MKKTEILDIIDRRISEKYKIMYDYPKGSAHDRAYAQKYELFDLKMEIEKIGRKSKK